MRLALCALALMTVPAACGPPEQEEVPDEAPSVQAAMTRTIDPASQRIQQAVLDLHTETGELDPDRLSDERWVEVANAACEMELVSFAIATSGTLTIAGDGTSLPDRESGAPTLDEVRAKVAASPGDFRDRFRTLAAAAQAVNLAAESREAGDLEQAALELGDTCSSCHAEYWYERESE